ncbi:MAG TPA: sialidase family protein [Gammaproteobacteria bacterium]
MLAAACAALVACGDRPEPPPAAPALTAVDVPAAPGSGEPRLSAGPDGTPVLSWVEPDGEGYALRYARWSDGAFGPPATVASGADWFVNPADLPSVVPITDDVWAAHWLVISPESVFAYDVAVAHSRDGGRSWSEPMLLNDDGTATEHGFATLFEWDGAIGAVWLDGRNFALATGDEDPATIGTSLRAARLSYDGTKLADEAVDDVVCDCCRTDAVAAGDALVVVYRDRTPEERRDVVVRRFADGRWTEPVELGRDGWIIEGCPVNGPAMDARGDDVAVAWFTAAEGAPRVRFARSRDGGATFAPAMDIDGAGALGQVGTALLDNGTAAVSWWRNDAYGGTELAVRLVQRDGSLGAPFAAARVDGPRPSDVPQMSAAEGGLLFAWTDAASGTVKAAFVPLP